MASTVIVASAIVYTGLQGPQGLPGATQLIEGGTELPYSDAVSALTDLGAAAVDHGHEIEDVDGLSVALSDKQDTLTGVSDVPGLVDALGGKAASSHTHAAGDITSGTLPVIRGGTGADLSSTGGTGQVLKQTTAGGAVSVGALSAGDIPSGVDASKIGSGTVSNAEFGYLDGVTSSIQTQLDNKAASSHIHSADDITSGTLPIARGGTGASTASGARINLDVPSNSDLSNHATNTSNPHSVTAAQVGAYTAAEIDALLADLAPLLHEHDAGDITSGTLPVARGGFGGLTWQAIPMMGPSGTAVESGIFRSGNNINFMDVEPRLINTTGRTLALSPSSSFIDLSGSVLQLQRFSTTGIWLCPGGGHVDVMGSGLTISSSTGADHQRWAYNSTYYATRRVDSLGNLRDRVSGTSFYWYASDIYLQVATLSASSAATTFQLHDRSGDATPNVYLGLLQGGTRIGYIGYLDDHGAPLYVTQEHATGPMILRTTGTGAIYLQPGNSTLFQFTADSKIGAFGATPVARPVVPTGSTTNQIITALQSLGWFAQS